MNGTGQPLDRNERHYDVGYCRPPQEHQFKKGQTSPRKGKKRRPTLDIGAFLDDSVEAFANGKRVRRSEFEVRLNSLIKRALTGNVSAISELLRLAKTAGMFKVTEPLSLLPGAAYIPKDWDRTEWERMYKHQGPPPWRGERDGWHCQRDVAGSGGGC